MYASLLTFLSRRSEALDRLRLRRLLIGRLCDLRRRRGLDPVTAGAADGQVERLVVSSIGGGEKAAAGCLKTEQVLHEQRRVAGERRQSRP